MWQRSLTLALLEEDKPKDADEEAKEDEEEDIAIVYLSVERFELKRKCNLALVAGPVDK